MPARICTVVSAFLLSLLLMSIPFSPVFAGDRSGNESHPPNTSLRPALEDTSSEAPDSVLVEDTLRTGFFFELGFGFGRPDWNTAWSFTYFHDHHTFTMRRTHGTGGVFRRIASIIDPDIEGFDYSGVGLLYGLNAGHPVGLVHAAVGPAIMRIEPWEDEKSIHTALGIGYEVRVMFTGLRVVGLSLKYWGETTTDYTLNGITVSVSAGDLW
jgi:hypothetical protein